MKKADLLFAWLLVVGGLLHSVQLFIKRDSLWEFDQALVWYLEAGLGLVAVGILNLLRIWNRSPRTQFATLAANVLLLSITVFNVYVLTGIGSVLLLVVALAVTGFSLFDLGRSAVGWKPKE